MHRPQAPAPAIVPPPGRQRLAWGALAAWLAWSAGCLAWWVAQDPARLQSICRSIAP